MSFRKEWFVELEACNGVTVSLGDNSLLEAKGRGTVIVKKLVNGEWQNGRLENVLYIPQLQKNLFSLGACTAKGHVVVVRNDGIDIYSRQNKLIAHGIKQENNLYRLAFIVNVKHEANAAIGNTLKLWHDRLGHVNNKYLRAAVENNLVNGVKISEMSDFFCESCQYGKQHRLAFKSKNSREMSRPGKFIHTDLCGPMQTPSIGGAKYFILFKDDCTGFRHVYFLRHKDDVFDVFKEYEAMILNKFGRRIQTIRSDNGTEYSNHELRNYLKSHGIQLERSAPYTPEQNGSSEREMRTIVESARTMLLAKGLLLVSGLKQLTQLFTC